MPVPSFPILGLDGHFCISYLGLKVFCAMGCSGSPELLKMVVSSLRTVPDYNVVCATTSIMDPLELGSPTDRFFSTRFLPAPEVNELADVAVILGGQGTVQTAVWAGPPVVGMGFQWEQQANLDRLARVGVGIRIPINAVTAQRLLSSVRTVSGPAYRDRMKRLQRLVRSCNGAGKAVEEMDGFVKGMKG